MVNDQTWSLFFASIETEMVYRFDLALLLNFNYYFLLRCKFVEIWFRVTILLAVHVKYILLNCFERAPKVQLDDV